MNMAIVDVGTGSRVRSAELNTRAYMIKVHGEYLVERIIRIARQSGVKKVFCILNENKQELKEYVSTNNFGIPVSVNITTTHSPIHDLFALAPLLQNASFIMITPDIVFDEREFTDFINYSFFLQKETDGTLAITRYVKDENPLCVAMDEEDTILKFSDSKEGYNWAIGGIYFFTSRIFENTLETGVYGLRKLLHLLVSRGYLLKGFSFSKIINVGHVSDICVIKDFITKEMPK